MPLLAEVVSGQLRFSVFEKNFITALYVQQALNDDKSKGSPLPVDHWDTAGQKGCLYIWRRKHYAVFWLGKISFIMGKKTQKAMQH